MANRIASNRILLTISVIALILVTLVPAPAMAKAGDTSTSTLPDFVSFLQSVNIGTAGELSGVYVPGIMAVKVIDQPGYDAGFVSREDETLTHFKMVDSFGSIGLLAHNHLAGKYFPSILPGQIIYLVYGNGEVNTYIVTQTLSVQAYEPYNPYGSFRDLTTSTEYSAEQLFYQVYTGTPHLTLQTCIAQGDEPSWGRLFVMAVPLTQYYAQ
jgi:hypothetical protein